MPHKTESMNPLKVRMPNGNTMDSTHTALLCIPDLSEASSLAHVSPGMAKNSLLSVVQLYKEGYYVTFNIYGVTIFNAEINCIMKGHQDLDTGLWLINLRPNNKHMQISEANNVYELYNTGALVNYLHKELFRPTELSLLKSIKNSTS